jgi:hypothetical protein
MSDREISLPQAANLVKYYLPLAANFFLALWLPLAVSSPAMNSELTTAQVADRLERPERTIRLWCKQGRFPGAYSQETPRGSFWLIPEKALEGFTEPPMGRPKTDKPVETKPTRKRATGR